MVTFNLMPWRHHIRHHQTRKFKITLFITMMIVLIFLSGTHILLVSKEKLLKLHIEKLKNKSRKYDHHQLRSSRANLPQKKIMKILMMELSRINFPRICFTDIVRHDNKIVFNGLTPSAYDLTEFFNQWEMKNLFSEVRIQQIENTNNGSKKFIFQSLLI